MLWPWPAFVPLSLLVRIPRTLTNWATSSTPCILCSCSKHALYCSSSCFFLTACIWFPTESQAVVKGSNSNTSLNDYLLMILDQRIVFFFLADTVLPTYPQQYVVCYCPSCLTCSLCLMDSLPIMWILASFTHSICAGWGVSLVA